MTDHRAPEKVTLWRHKNPRMTQPFSLKGPDAEWNMAAKTGWEPATALIVPEGSVGVVLDDVHVAHEVAHLCNDRARRCVEDSPAQRHWLSQHKLFHDAAKSLTALEEADHAA